MAHFTWAIQGAGACCPGWPGHPDRCATVWWPGHDNRTGWRGFYFLFAPGTALPTGTGSPVGMRVELLRVIIQ